MLEILCWEMQLEAKCNWKGNPLAVNVQNIRCMVCGIQVLIAQLADCLLILCLKRVG